MYSKMIKTDGDIIITQRGIADTFFSNVDIQLMDQINTIDQVKSSYAMIVGASPVGHLPIAGIYGVSENRLPHYRLQSGKYPRHGEVILGNNLTKQLSGRSVKIGNKRFKISGSFTSDIGFEEGGVVMHIDNAGALFSRSASYILVAVKSPGHTKEIQNKIAAMDTEIEVKTTQRSLKTLL